MYDVALSCFAPHVGDTVPVLLMPAGAAVANLVSHE
jgi:hypothetical protein